MIARIRRQRFRLWLEALIALAAIALWLATALWPDWIELVLHVEPDDGDGSLERILAIAFPATAFVATLLTEREWRMGLSRAT